MPIIWGRDGRTAASLAFIALPRLAHFVLVLQPVGTVFSIWKMRAVLATSRNHGEDLVGWQCADWRKWSTGPGALRGDDSFQPRGLSGLEGKR